MASLSYNKEAEIIQAFNSTSRYLDDLLNIDNPYFEGIVGRIIHLNYNKSKASKANAFDTEAPFLDLRLSIRFARVSNNILTGKLLHQGYRYHKLRKPFSKFYRQQYDLVSKFKVGLKYFCNRTYWNQNFMVSWPIN